jgi:hypothetical protein
MNGSEEFSAVSVAYGSIIGIFLGMSVLSLVGIFG